MALNRVYRVARLGCLLSSRSRHSPLFSRLSCYSSWWCVLGKVPLIVLRNPRGETSVITALWWAGLSLVWDRHTTFYSNLVTVLRLAVLGTLGGPAPYLCIGWKLHRWRTGSNDIVRLCWGMVVVLVGLVLVMTCKGVLPSRPISSGLVCRALSSPLVWTLRKSGRAGG